MEVAFHNDYYPPPSVSPDFTVEPTAATEELLDRLGLLFQASAAGFSILYNDDKRRRESLLRSLRREAVWEGSPPQPRVWTRLSFVLRLDNPLYVNFSRLPLDFDPAERNFYFSNRTAHRKHGVTLLNRGSHVTEKEIVWLAPMQLRVPVDSKVKEVRVLAISGEIVLCQPRCVPAELALRMPPDAIPCGQAGLPPEICRSSILFDFSLLPEGRYTIQEIGYAGEILAQWEMLSTASRPVPFAFIDLLFTRPKPEEGGIYPVRGLWTRNPVIAGVDYQLVFRRRSTLWRYYIVLPGGAEPGGLEIQSLLPPREWFWGPDPVHLGDGTPASLFTSRRPLPLQAHPDLRFFLRSDAGVLLDPLPVASSRQVLPVEAMAPPPASDAISDIYVYV